MYIKRVFIIIVMGEGGSLVPWNHEKWVLWFPGIMKNELEFLADSDKKGLGGYFSEEFVKTIIRKTSNHVTKTW